VAHVKSTLQRRLEKVLAEAFPAPAQVKLDDVDGIIGVITSVRFEGMDSMDRQNLINKTIKVKLSPEERRHVQIIVGVTPEEGTGYLASE
jgi:hypothetical protein